MLRLGAGDSQPGMFRVGGIFMPSPRSWGKICLWTVSSSLLMVGVARRSDLHEMCHQPAQSSKARLCPARPPSAGRNQCPCFMRVPMTGSSRPSTWSRETDHWVENTLQESHVVLEKDASCSDLPGLRSGSPPRSFEGPAFLDGSDLSSAFVHLPPVVKRTRNAPLALCRGDV